MKKTLKMGLILTFMLFILTGCTNTDYNVKINRNDTGKVEYTVEYDENALNEMLEEEEGKSKEEKLNESLALAEDLDLFAAPIKVAEDKGYSVENNKKDNYTIGYTATKEFENIIEQFKVEESLPSEYITITEDTGIKKEKGFFVTKYTQSFQIDLTKGGEIINKVKVSYDFPKGFVNSNADEKSSILGTTLTWNLGKGEIRKIEYTVYSINMPIIIIAIISLVVIIVGIVLWVKKIKKNSKDNAELSGKNNKK